MPCVFLYFDFRVFVSCLVSLFWFSMPHCVSCPLSFSYVLPSVSWIVPFMFSHVLLPPRHHTWPSPSSLSLPVARLFISICVFSLSSLQSLSGHCICQPLSAPVHVPAPVISQFLLVCVFGVALEFGVLPFVPFCLFVFFALSFALIKLVSCSPLSLPPVSNCVWVHLLYPFLSFPL